MKKTIVIPISLFFLLFFMVVASYAQTPEATFLSGNNLQKTEIIRLQIKDDLKLSEAKFDSVAVIQKDFQSKARKVKLDKQLTEPLKEKRVRDLTETKSKRLKSAGLDDEELKKVENYFQHSVFP